MTHFYWEISRWKIGQSPNKNSFYILNFQILPLYKVSVNFFLQNKELNQNKNAMNKDLNILE